ncbi:MAG: hypothetical protein P1U86_22945, partial [Verrucomicrobiales bacterium]|nr:hypothetical protein [Verrucomicrobiales bacterium]
KHFKSDEMKKYLGRIADSRGHAFAKQVFEKVKTLLPGFELEAKMRSLGAPKNPDLGDIDVLAWDTSKNTIFLIECKRLRKSLSPRDVINRLEEFKGKKGDSLGKHTRRAEWLKNNPDVLAKKTGIPAAKIKWVPLLVTSGRVPMTFLDGINFPKNNVVPFSEIEQILTCDHTL